MPPLHAGLDNLLDGSFNIEGGVDAATTISLSADLVDTVGDLPAIAGGDAVSPTLDTLLATADPMNLVLGGVALASVIGLAVLAASEEQPDSSTTTTKSSESSARPAPKPKSNVSSTGVAINVSSSDGASSEDLIAEKEKAMQAFRRGYGAESEELLQEALSTLIAKVESTRANLGQEKTLRTDVESQIAKLAQEMQDLEDKYELGQNALQRTIKALQRTEKDLGEAQKVLKETQESLELTAKSLAILEEERQSLRKLGRAAWQLSKQRVRRRIQSIRGRFSGDKDSGDSDKEE